MSKQLRSNNISLIALVFFLLVVTILLAIVDYKGRLSKIRDNIKTWIVYPMKTISMWPRDVVYELSDYLKAKDSLLIENELLKKENFLLKVDNLKNNVLELELNRVKDLLSFSQESKKEFIFAKIIDKHINSSKYQLEINKGSEQGIKYQQVAIATNGIVGKVTDVSEKTSLITLLTDIYQRIPAYIERNGLSLIVAGNGNLYNLSTLFVKKNSDIKKGDKLFTSGLGKVYPKNYFIGTVSNIEYKTENKFLSITITPAVFLDKIFEVLLINDI